MDKKTYLLIAVALPLLIIGGIYAYTYTNATGIIGITPPTGDIATANATPTQPSWDSVLTPVTDQIIFRPGGIGDETGVKYQFPDTGDHWDKVDETTSDDDTTYIYTDSTPWEEDLYQIPDHSTQTAGGDVNHIEVYMVSRATVDAEQLSAYVHIKTNGVEFNGPTENLTTSYAPYSNQWIANPQSGSFWTWADIDGLQIGVGLTKAGVGIASQCTQVYAEVSFDAPELNDNTPTGDLFEITPDPAYGGNLQVRVYLTNTNALLKAYKYLNMELYLEGSEEAGKTPNYQVLNLDNGVATFNLVGISGGSYTMSVTGGTYELQSREIAEWKAGYTVTPELYCEATQR